MRRLTDKQRVFVEEYLRCWNATEAARRAGYSERWLHTNASKLLQDTRIQELIKERLTDVTMSADEVLQRLAQKARGDDRDTLKALELVGKHHKLFTERHEIDATHTVSDDVLDAIGGALKRGYGDGDAED